MNQTKYTSQKNTSFHTKTINNLNCLHLFHRNRESSFSIVWRFEKRKQKTWCDWLKLATTGMDAISGQFQMNDDALFDWMDMDGLQTRWYSCQIWESVHYMHKTPWTNIGIGTCILMNGSIIYLHTPLFFTIYISTVYIHIIWRIWRIWNCINCIILKLCISLVAMNLIFNDQELQQFNTQLLLGMKTGHCLLTRDLLSALRECECGYGSIWPSKTLGVIFFSE